MSLQVQSWESPFSKSTPLTDVIAWIAMLAFDFASMEGRVVTNISMDETSAHDGSAPLGQWGVALGQSFTFKEDGEEITVTFPTLEKIVADNQECFDAIRAYLYDKLKYMPPFRGAQSV